MSGGHGTAKAAASLLCVVLHDVAPATWTGCLRVLRQVQAQAAAAGVRLRVTLLVVPRFHGEPTPPAFVRWLHRMALAGHELVLHGWQHRDDAALTGGWRDRLLRRWYTAGEGEFSALDVDQAAARLRLGLNWLAEHRLPNRGFVAPAWLMSRGSWAAVAAAPLRYTCTLTEVISLPDCQRLHARSLVFSTRSAWRRALSVAWNRLQAVRQRQAPLLRLELHPTDADHAAVLHCWTTVLRRALHSRRPVTLGEAAETLQRPVPLFRA